MSSEQERLRAEFREWIQTETVRVAFDYLCDHAATLRTCRADLRMQGHMRTMRYRRGAEWPFGFIVNRESLLFYVRKAGQRDSTLSVDALRAHFAEVSRKPHEPGEITVRIATVTDAEAITARVLGRC
jgi:hypothetical protein